MDIMTILNIAGWLISSGIAIWKAWQAHDRGKVASEVTELLETVIEGVDKYAHKPQMQPNQLIEETIRQTALVKGVEQKLNAHVKRVKKVL